METHAIIVAVGNELTSGLTVETNAAELSRRLAEMGIPVRAHHTVDDHVEPIAAAIASAAAQAPLVIVTGGLGPTADDLTREALAVCMGVELAVHEPSLKQIAERFERMHRAMSPTNRRQALLPVGAEALDNLCGTAPGICARLGDDGGSTVFVLPGVPREMREMFARHVAPRLAPLAGKRRIVFRSVHTFGAGESTIGAELADVMERNANPLIGTTASSGVVTVRITAQGDDQAAADRLADEAVQSVTSRLGSLALGTDDDSMASVVGRMLRDRGETVCTAESCTGGLVGKLLTEAAGSSDYYVGGVVCYANRAKRDILGVGADTLVSHGAVSEPVAEALAGGARERLAATYALAITGIAGPGGGSDDKPVGLVYTALAGPEGVVVQRNVFPGDRAAVRLRAALTALNMLRLELGFT